MQRKGLLIILSSPSGAGKSTLARRLMAWDPTLKFSVSATTRPPRPGEVDGREYHFRTRGEFDALVEQEAFLEYATVFGNRYGSLKSEVYSALAGGSDVLFDIDWQGGQQIKTSSSWNEVVSIFLLPPSIAALETRLRHRAQDSDDTIARRMSRSKDEISHWAEYEYVLVNDDPDVTFEDLKSIVTAERLRRNRQIGLTDFVGGLNKEFEAR